MATSQRVRAVIRHHERRDMFLVMLNKLAKPGRMTIMLPGGGVEAGEGPLDALVREIREELGISVDVTANNCGLVSRATYEWPGEDTRTSRVELLFYRLLGVDQVVRNMEPEKVFSVSWVTLAEVERLVGIRWDPDHLRYSELPGAEENFVAQMGFFEAVRAALDLERPAQILGATTPPDSDGSVGYRKTSLPYGAD